MKKRYFSQQQKKRRQQQLPAEYGEYGEIAPYDDSSAGLSLGGGGDAGDAGDAGGGGTRAGAFAEPGPNA